MTQSNASIDKIYQTGAEQLASQKKNLEDFFKNYDGWEAVKFAKRVLDMRADPKLDLLVWEIFRSVIPHNEGQFLGGLHSFTVNCLLDDSYYLLEWRKPATHFVSNKVSVSGLEVEMGFPEIQYNPDGSTKMVICDKEDPAGVPWVTYSNDLEGSQNVKPLMEALDIAIARTEKRRREYEAEFGEEY